jgi:hypothetical protein
MENPSQSVNIIDYLDIRLPLLQLVAYKIAA